ncbi:hypothetical protein VOLCADRAFT_106050 [Volvox carteri f. nagariensis]|uniref:C2 domain-containing protein n=1 Tax=Volvox carteri f. nagariensis TaxID=3068 RepID=D8U4S5_VOLCA|nr:uncharacterized protein VOLCADRAFT_106050 [Volvox carteri f. nagariensis]EFJ45326.1 hypothetical protein VOLCADRAFT_106050 [Volvox carteri f. nagariensis]|eukprot:XP_002953702.1 hypothetical protein VOLCADRAFT_106050 [Volvox carteri f. nagariensis]
MTTPGGLQFDLPRAVGLAGAAFGAYRDPKPVNRFEDFDVKDTTVIVMEKEFLSQAYWGILEVYLVRADDLPAGVPGELLEAPSPYAVVSMVSPATLQARSRPLKFNSSTVSRSPVWDPNRPAMLFPVRDPTNDELRIELYDEAPSTHRPLRNEYPLGNATLRLNELLQQGEDLRETRLLLHMSLTGGHIGDSSITIRCRMRPMTTADPHHLEALTTCKTLEMSWDAPMEIGLNVVEWLRRSAYDKVTWEYLKDVMEAAGGRVGDLYPLAFINNCRTNTEAWVFRNIDDRRVVVAFRGTSVTADWLIDLWTVPVPDTAIRPKEPGPAGVDPSMIRMHRGFLEGYKSVRAAVLQLVDDVLRTDGRGGPWKVEVTGHSLGGALATVAAYDIAWNKRDRDRRRQAGPTIGSVAMVTFGAPRVGNFVFAKDFNAVLPDAWRVHNHNDIVSSVPFTFGFWNFTHVGKDVRMAWNNEPTASNHEVEKWMLTKVLSRTPVSSHLEFRYQDTMLKMVRKWIRDRVPQPQQAELWRGPRARESHGTGTPKRTAQGLTRGT